MKRKLRIGHSPDPDDAFMFFALAHGHVSIEGFEIEHVIEDIQSLNQRALRSELEVTAISAHAYAFVADRYWLLSSGASMGKGYGPILVSKRPVELSGLSGKKIAVPGKLTTASLLLNLYLNDYKPVEISFDRIIGSVQNGEVDAGLLIHEGQITFEKYNLEKIFDLGKVWEEETGLPLPLGLDVVRADLTEPIARGIAKALRESIEYAYSHEEEALSYALQFGRGIERNLGTRFVKMYVDQDTIDMGQRGEQALELLYTMAFDRHLIPKKPTIKVIST